MTLWRDRLRPAGMVSPFFSSKAIPKLSTVKLKRKKINFSLQTRKFSNEKLTSMVKYAENVRVTFMRILFILCLFVEKTERKNSHPHLAGVTELRKGFFSLRPKKKNLLIKSEKFTTVPFSFRDSMSQMNIFPYSGGNLRTFFNIKHIPVSQKWLRVFTHSRLRLETEHNWLLRTLKIWEKELKVGSFLMDYYVLICFHERTRKIDQLWCQEHIATT